jgi:hypothetical protein
MRPFLTAIAILSLAAPLSAQGAPAAAASAPSAASAAEDELVKLEKQSWEAWKNHDGQFFAGFLSDDHTEVGFGGRSGKAAVVAAVASGMCSVKSYEVGDFKLALLDSDTALLTYHAAQDTTCGGKPVPSPVWVSSLFVRRGGRWLNVLYQQTQTFK